MEKIRFGIIGTNVITEQFIESLHRVGTGEVVAVYSRTEERAKTYAQKHNIPYIFTNIEEMVKSDRIDAVYIASPNVCHAEQAVVCMEYGKHVLCEKPLASHAREVEHMIEVASKQGVILMEAMKNIHTKNFKELEAQINHVGKVRKYVASFCQYSSRYDAYRRGEVLNAFKPELSNGALMDIGVYCIAPMVKLFGMPTSIQAVGTLLETGVDGEGSILFGYPDMTAAIHYSKITNSSVATEIQGEEGNLVIDKISQISKVTFEPRQGEVVTINKESGKMGLCEEIEDFIALVREDDSVQAQEWLATTYKVMKIMDEARKQLGVIYPADCVQV